jgi:hypothetical protein
MGELSFLTIIVSLAVCSILVFAVYQYMKVRFIILEQSQKEQALILQQYIEESSYDIQGLQEIVFRKQGGGASGIQHHQQQQPSVTEVEEVVYDTDDLNKHIHMDTVMYEAPNKQRSSLIAISSDSEDTTSDGDDSESESSDHENESDSDSDSDSDSESSESDHDQDSGGESDDDSDHDLDSDVKHIEISIPVNDQPDIDPVSIIDELPETTATTDVKTITVDLGVSVQCSSSPDPDTIDVLSLLNKPAVINDDEQEPVGDMTTLEKETVNVPGVSSAAASSTSAAAASPSSALSGLSVVELRALLKEKYKGQPEKILNLNKFKKPELIQLLQE